MTTPISSTVNTTITTPRPIDSLILDAGPILSSASAPSYYLTSADHIYTTPSVISEICDASARSRFETLWRPFLNIRSPKPESLRFVAEFAKKTGDYEALSRTDLELVALGYERELEVAGGDWRLRRTPGQKELNGPTPEEGWGWEGMIMERKDEGKQVDTKRERETPEKPEDAGSGIAQSLEDVRLEDSTDAAATELQPAPPAKAPASDSEGADASDDPESDSEGWITPSNLHKHVGAPSAPAIPPPSNQKLTVALATIDFALQNVLLQLNLHLLSPASLQRITHTRSTVLRCHACFFILRHPGNKPKDFCPRCGGARTLLRTTCSTDKDGIFRIHLKRNFQYNNRGNVYSIPKPHHGSASGRGVPEAPVLREDQKEYQRAVRREGYRKEKDLLDPDALPSILSGQRKWQGGVRIGMGRRNPNEPRRGGGRRKK